MFQNIKTIEENTTVCYVRTTTNTYKFTLTERFLWWNPTAHIDSADSIETVKGYVRFVNETHLTANDEDMPI